MMLSMDKQPTLRMATMLAFRIMTASLIVLAPIVTSAQCEPRFISDAVTRLYYSPSWFNEVNYVVTIDSIDKTAGVERVIYCGSILDGREREPFRYVVHQEGAVTLYTSDPDVFAQLADLCAKVGDRFAQKNRYVEYVGEIAMPYWDTVLAVKIFLEVLVIQQGGDSVEVPNNYLYVSNDLGPIQEMSYDLHDVTWPLRGAVIGDRVYGVTTTGLESNNVHVFEGGSGVSLKSVGEGVVAECLSPDSDLHDIDVMCTDVIGKSFDLEVDRQIGNHVNIRLPAQARFFLLYARCRRHGTFGNAQFMY